MCVAVLIDREHRQLRRVGVAPLACERVLGGDAHADLHRVRQPAFMLAQRQDLAGIDRVGGRSTIR